MGADADRRLVAGRYVLGGPLGRGGMGTVWRADDVLLGRPVAVKEVELPAGADRAALRERALREARAAARIGLELLDALDAAHRAGIVHHDVKPANVMVSPSGRVKLADFGIASLQEDTQRTLTGATGAMRGRGDGRAVTAVFGSLPYVAPEQASGGHAGPAADLWALGATLWFAVEGVAPFERASPAATLGAILHDPPGRPSRAGPLEPALLALLAKDPTHRPPATVVRRMLEPLTTGGSPFPSHPTVPLAAGTSTLPSAGTVPRRRGRDPLPGWTAPPRRRRWGRRLLVAAGVLLLLAVASNLGDDRRAGRGPAGLGDPVRDGQFEFVVRSVDCGARSVGQDLGRRRALGQFCMVGLRVENTGGEGRTFGGGQQYPFDDVGKRHDPDLDATFRHGDGQLLSTHLNPGQRLEGTLVYDVPDPVGLARVELHDGPFSGGVSVALGRR